MMNNKIAVIGAGGFGREVFSMISGTEYQCVGFIDYASDRVMLPAPVLGNEDDIIELKTMYGFSNCAIAIGDIGKRKEIFVKISKFDIDFPTIVHSSVQSFSVALDIGTIIYPNVVIMNDCRVGKFSLLNSGVTLGHDVVIGNFCSINPGVHLAGNICVGDRAFLGIGAKIVENISIGNNAIVGAGSVVLHDVPDNTKVYGIPAREVS